MRLRRGYMRIVWVGGIVILVAGSLVPASWLPRIVSGGESLHFAAYFLLAIVPCWSERTSLALASGVAILALGVALEFAQRLSPGRAFEVSDIVADAAGVLFGLAAGACIARLRSRAEIPSAPQ